MFKFSHFPVLNQDNSKKFILPSVSNLTLEANTSSMSVSSLGGRPILQNEEHQDPYPASLLVALQTRVLTTNLYTRLN